MSALHIPGHVVAPYQAFDAVRFRANILADLENVVPTSARSSMPSAGTWVTTLTRDAAYALGLLADVPLTRRSLRAAADAAAITWLGSGRRGSVTFPFDGHLHTGVAGPEHYCGTPMLWTTGVLLALATRADANVRAALQYPIDLTLTGGSTTYDRYHELFARALHAHLEGSADASDRLALAIEAAKLEHITVTSPQRAHRARAMMLMIDATRRRDQPSFTDAAVAAIDAHARLATRGDEVDMMDAFYDFEIAGVAALGRTTGISWEIECPYVPTWLVKG